MSIEAWWPNLQPASREWLIDNNGDAVPVEVVDDIVAAGGTVSKDAAWVGEVGPEGFYLSDAAVDWVEAMANGESPDPE